MTSSHLIAVSKRTGDSVKHTCQSLLFVRGPVYIELYEVLEWVSSNLKPHQTTGISRNTIRPGFQQGKSIMCSPSMKSAVSMTIAQPMTCRHGNGTRHIKPTPLGTSESKRSKDNRLWMVSQIRTVQLKALTSIYLSGSRRIERKDSRRGWNCCCHGLLSLLTIARISSCTAPIFTPV